MLVSVARRVTCPGDTQLQPLTVTRSALATRDSCVAVMADWVSMKVRPGLGAGREKRRKGWAGSGRFCGVDSQEGPRLDLGEQKEREWVELRRVSLRWVLTAGPVRSVRGLLPGQLDGTPRSPLLPGLP